VDCSCGKERKFVRKLRKGAARRGAEQEERKFERSEFPDTHFI
jgi:hypothetical protein